MTRAPEPTASLDIALAHAAPAGDRPALAGRQAAEILRVVQGHPLAPCCSAPPTARAAIAQAAARHPRAPGASHSPSRRRAARTGHRAGPQRPRRRGARGAAARGRAQARAAARLARAGRPPDRDRRQREAPTRPTPRMSAIRLRDPALLAGGDALCEQPHPGGRSAAARAPEAARRPTSPRIRMLAEVAARLGRDDDAEALLARCLELAPGFHAARAQLRAGAATAATGTPKRWRRPKRCSRPTRRNPSYRNLKAVDPLPHRRLRAGDRALRGDRCAEHPRPAEALDELRPRAEDRGPPGRARSPPTAAASRSIPASARPTGAWPTSRPSASTPADVAAMRAQLARSDLAAEDRLTSNSRWARRWRTPATTPRRSSTTSQATRCASATASLRAPTRPPRACGARGRRYTPRVLRRSAPGCGSDAPDPIFIVGLPRAGSTLIEQILSSHSAGRRHDGAARDHRDHARLRQRAPSRRRRRPTTTCWRRWTPTSCARSASATSSARASIARPARRSSSTRCRTTSRTSA